MILLDGKPRVIKESCGALGVWTGLSLIRLLGAYGGTVQAYVGGATQTNSIQKPKTGFGVNKMSDYRIKALVEHGGAIWSLEQLFRMVSGYPEHYVTKRRTQVLHDTLIATIKDVRETQYSQVISAWEGPFDLLVAPTELRLILNHRSFSLPVVEDEEDVN